MTQQCFIAFFQTRVGNNVGLAFSHRETCLLFQPWKFIKGWLFFLMNLRISLGKYFPTHLEDWDIQHTNAFSQIKNKTINTKYLLKCFCTIRATCING